MADDLARGRRAGGRYRLEEELGRGGVCTVWRAVDETLEREVAIRFFDTDLDRSDLTERAGVAASLTHARVVRLFDSGFEDGRFFTVTELLPGSLAGAGLPMPPDEALRTGVQIAEALVYAHQRGVAHGALHPSNVLLGEQGAKVSDFALAGEALAAPAVSQSYDLKQFGHVLYAMLTGGDAADDPPAALVPDVPKGLARVVRGLLDGAYPTARAVLSDLNELLPQPPPHRRSILPYAIAAGVVLLALGALAALRFFTPGQGTEPRTSPPPKTEPYPVRAVTDFDPLGDEHENSGRVGRVIDGTARTFWATERYSSGRHFSGKKRGVGVVIDLGQSRAVAAARVGLVTPGCDYEIRHAAGEAHDIDVWKVVAAVRNAGKDTTSHFEVVRDRFWLLWITGLTRGVPGAGSGWACGVTEISLFPP